MFNFQRKTTLGMIVFAGLAISPLAISHYNDKEPPQSYRQSWFAMIAANFGPMGSMVKGEITGRKCKWLATPTDQTKAQCALTLKYGKKCQISKIKWTTSKTR